jgi:hypothetical protein
VPENAHSEWSKELRTPSFDHSDEEGSLPTAGTFPEEGMSCPCCVNGRLRVFGEAVFLGQEGGKQSGVIKFEEARTDDSKLTWDSRLEHNTAHSNYQGEDKFPAKIGYRAGVQCSKHNCWEARGISRYADLPAAVFAAGAIAAAKCSLDNEEVLDLATLASDLEADSSKQAKLVKGALKWFDYAKNRDMEDSAFHQILRVAKKLLS